MRREGDRVGKRMREERGSGQERSRATRIRAIMEPQRQASWGGGKGGSTREPDRGHQKKKKVRQPRPFLGALEG